MSCVVAAAVVDDDVRCLEMSVAQLNRAPIYMQAVMNNDIQVVRFIGMNMHGN
jgi:hypothetical protein